MKSITTYTLLPVALGLIAGATLCLAQPAQAPKVGDAAPLVSGRTEQGETWKLADAKGKQNVILYFYPKDDTPGCTKEACGLRDQMGDLKKLDVEVIGVSFDSAESHRAFIAKHNLNFSLLADTDGKIADAFGVRQLGRNVARRVSFLIGKDGRVAHVVDSPQADIHLSEMKDAVTKLQRS